MILKAILLKKEREKKTFATYFEVKLISNCFKMDSGLTEQHYLLKTINIFKLSDQ